MRWLIVFFIFFQNVNLSAEFNLKITYPVIEELFIPGSYYGRSFFYDNDHLGEDFKLIEGTEIKSVLAGKIVKYGPASGYGSLVVVVESDLGQKIEFMNAYGQLVETDKVLFIYGHLKKENLNWQEGDFIESGQVLGFVENKEDNGDGAEHLHLGCRLQSQKKAMQVDPYAWYRGYEKATSFGDDFAAPSLVIEKIINLNVEKKEPDLKLAFNSKITWHPNGTLIKGFNNSDVYILIENKKHLIKDEEVFNAHSFNWQKIIIVSDEELACYDNGFIIDWIPVRKIVGIIETQEYFLMEKKSKNSIGCALYEIFSTSVLESWGFLNNDILWVSKNSFYKDYLECDDFILSWRPGTLLKPTFKLGLYSLSTVFWVDDYNELRAFETYQVFKDLGYTVWNILSVEESDFDKNDFSFGFNISSPYLKQCFSENIIVQEIENIEICEEGKVLETYSENKEFLSFGLCQSEIKVCINNEWQIIQEEFLPEVEIEDGYDNDCDGLVDEGFYVIKDKDVKDVSSSEVEVEYYSTETQDDSIEQESCSDVKNKKDYLDVEQNECSGDLENEKLEGLAEKEVYCEINCLTVGFSPVIWSGGWDGEFYKEDSQKSDFIVTLCELCYWGETKFHFNCKKEDIYNYGNEAEVKCYFNSEEIELDYLNLGQGKIQINFKNLDCNELCW